MCYKLFPMIICLLHSVSKLSPGNTRTRRTKRPAGNLGFEFPVNCNPLRKSSRRAKRAGENPRFALLAKGQIPKGIDPAREARRRKSRVPIPCKLQICKGPIPKYFDPAREARRENLGFALPVNCKSLKKSTRQPRKLATATKENWLGYERNWLG
jgi:hypothetical protein